MWEKSIERVLETYGDVFDKEKESHTQNRYDIWSSRTPLEQKLIEIRALEKASEFATIPNFESKMARLREEYQALQAREKLSHDTLKTRYRRARASAWLLAQFTVCTLAGSLVARQ